MKRWTLTFSAPYAFDPYELVPGETTVIGRAQGYADAAFGVDTLARRHAAIRWRGGGFVAVDLKTTNGSTVAGRRVTEPVALVERDMLAFGRLTARLETFDASPLDDVSEHSGWILYGRRRAIPQGRWPAFRRRAGRIERAIVAVPAESGPGVTVPDADGVLLAPFAHAVRASPPDALAFGSFVVTKTAHLPGLDASDLVVTWNGALARLPPRRTSSLLADEVKSVVPHVFGGHLDPADSYGFPPKRLAELVRALFPDAWRVEQELREQLEGLDDKGVRWLLERNQRTPS